MASAWGLSFGGAWGFSFGKTVIFDDDTHDGGDKKRRQQEAAKNSKKRQQIVRLFEQLVEGKPEVAKQIVAPIVQNASIVELKSINFDQLLADLSRVEQIYAAWIEMDDEEILALL